MCKGTVHDIKTVRIIMIDLCKIGNALEGLKELQGCVDSLDGKNQLVDLRSMLVDMKEEIINLREANVSLKHEAEKAADKQGLLEGLVEVDGFLYDRDDKNEPSGYPYCPKCLRTDDGPFKMLRLSQQVSVCPSCNSKYRIGGDRASIRRKTVARRRMVAACTDV